MDLDEKRPDGAHLYGKGGFANAAITQNGHAP
jgi:hypothetical protein